MSDLFGNHIVGFPTRRLKYRFTVCHQRFRRLSFTWKWRYILCRSIPYQTTCDVPRLLPLHGWSRTSGAGYQRWRRHSGNNTVRRYDQEALIVESTSNIIIFHVYFNAKTGDISIHKTCYSGGSNESHILYFRAELIFMYACRSNAACMIC